jgi:transposase-like protein
MRRSQFSDEQIIAILTEADKAIRELRREHGITDLTYYR